MEEVDGSNPSRSTKTFQRLTAHHQTCNHRIPSGVHTQFDAPGLWAPHGFRRGLAEAHPLTPVRTRRPVSLAAMACRGERCGQYGMRGWLLFCLPLLPTAGPAADAFVVGVCPHFGQGKGLLKANLSKEDESQVLEIRRH